jgi:hypothetical protein
MQSQHQTKRGSHPDGWSATHFQGSNSIGDLLFIVQAKILNGLREQ